MIPRVIAAVGLIAGLQAPLFASLTTGTLTIGTFDHEGAAVPDVLVSAMAGGGGERTLRTGRDGMVRVPLEVPPLRARARVEERPHYLLRDIVRGSDRSLIFRVFSSEPGALQGPERDDFAFHYLLVVRSRGNAGDISEELRQVATFLHPERPESPQGIAPVTDGAPRGVASVRLVNPRGNPVAGQAVLAYHYEEETGQVRLAGAERTDPEGYAVFPDLRPGLLHRVEAGLRGPEVAIGSFFRPSAEMPLDLPPMVIAPPDRMVRGVVSWDGQPLRNVEVTTEFDSGQPLLSTRTDAFGFYQLGPLSPGTVTLTLRRPDLTSERGVRWSQATGLAEVLIPLDIMVTPPPRGAGIAPPNP